jgi:hypothetical protein
LSLAASQSKDILHQYSEQSKSAIIQAWNSSHTTQLKSHVNELWNYIVKLGLKLREELWCRLDPQALYYNLVKVFWKKCKMGDTFIKVETLYVICRDKARRLFFKCRIHLWEHCRSHFRSFNKEKRFSNPIHASSAMCQLLGDRGIINLLTISSGNSIFVNSRRWLWKTRKLPTCVAKMTS